MRKVFFTCLIVFLTLQASAQRLDVYPTHWWAGMKHNKIQLMVHQPDPKIILVGNRITASSSSRDVKILDVKTVSNKRYAFFDIEIAPDARPQTVEISMNNPSKKKGQKFQFELKPRRQGNGIQFAKGVRSEDLMYLIMPDRFSNGDPTNDRVMGMLDQTLNRDSVFNRHGGDLKGIQNHLNYLQDLGVTTLWLNPVIENDMPNRTEHGYAFTNHYKIDRRLGGEKAYHALIEAVHAKGMKMIQDAVYNHVGTEHVLYKDQPDSSWFHRWPTFTQTSYKDQVAFDPYASAEDRKIFEKGWFVTSMPDWNQDNEMVQNFLIQHALWTVEEFGIDGWRIDTYAYNDLKFMNRCNEALYKEYPQITLFGETWVHGVPNQSYFCQNKYNIPFKSNLQATTDFQTLFYGIQAALTEPFGWTNGVNKLYTTLAQDFVYEDPMRQVVFLDNHDLPRFYSVLNEDTAKYKAAFGWMLTTRGIPQMYYGNEVLMAGITSPNDGYVRKDFPGGWENDPKNKFLQSGRTEKENQVFVYIKTLANFRKNSSALKNGKLIQFVPQNGVYVYFRYCEKQTIMCVLNTNEKSTSISLDRYRERTKNFKNGSEVVSKETIQLNDSVNCRPFTTQVFELN
ncbi:MAG TPA: alpha-amylase family glycosyl hydrolase [Niabella sp.]|nr:alpha-amylase family glycosyl hydrolase [Niabella sp.]